MEAATAEELELQRGNEPKKKGECCECHPKLEPESSNSGVPTSDVESLPISHQVVSTKNTEINKSWSDYHIPNEIWLEVLCRLPVKSLLRFRCVSKTWKSLIAHPEFIRLHLNRFKYSCQQTHLLCMQRAGGRLGDEWVVRCSNTFKTTDGLGCLRRAERLITFGCTSVFDDWEVVCSIDGLVMLREIDIYARVVKKEYLLWNPSIRKFRSLPIMSETRYEIVGDLGLGFDPLIKAYKFVRIVNHPVQDLHLIQIYTIGSGLWRTIQLQGRGYPSSFSVMSGYEIDKICDASCIYFVVENARSCDKKLVSFDVRSEMFASISFPKDTEAKHPALIHDRLLKVDGGCSLLRICYSTQRVSIWVVGIGTSGADSESMYWNKQYSFTVDDPCGFLYLKKNGDMLIEEEEKVISLNLENHKEKLVLKHTQPVMTMNAFGYKESLVWI